MSWFHILTPVSLDENVWLFCWKIIVTTPVPEIKVTYHSLLRPNGFAVTYSAVVYFGWELDILFGSLGGHQGVIQ
jgi:hypothetical protein